MIAHNLLGTKRDITATAAAAASEVEADTDADADRDTTAAITVVDTNLAGGNSLVVRAASRLLVCLTAFSFCLHCATIHAT